MQTWGSTYLALGVRLLVSAGELDALHFAVAHVDDNALVSALRVRNTRRGRKKNELTRLG